MEYLSPPYNVKGSTFATKKHQYFTEVITLLRAPVSLNSHGTCRLCGLQVCISIVHNRQVLL